MTEDTAGGIVISGSGSLAVATDELFGLAQALEHLGADARQDHLTLTMTDVSVSPGVVRSAAVPASAVTTALAAEAEIDAARLLLIEAHDRALAIAAALRSAALAYGEAEESRERIAQQLAARLGSAAGSLTPLMLLAALPALIVGGELLATVALVPGGLDGVRRVVGAWMNDHRSELNNPATIALIRLLVMSTDDYFGGLVQLPPELVAALGDEGAGVTGVNTAAAAIVIGAAPFGLLKETDVAVTPVPTAGIPAAGTVPPRGIANRLDRIPGPESEDGSARVRIDTIHVPGKPDRYEVFIAGTVSWGAGETTTPFDMTSNLQGVAGLDPGSRRAVELAMADSGITSSSEVVFTGYSQGALVARALAASGDYQTAGLVTFGGPGGQIELPDSFPALIVEHTDDLVPALGGSNLAPDAVTVQREVYGHGRPMDNEFVVPAHERSNYRDTAVMIDQAESDQVRSAVREIERMSAGATSVTSVSYLAARVRP